MTTILLLPVILAQALAPSDAQRAVEHGYKTQKASAAILTAFASPYTVMVQGPLGRLEAHGAESAKNLQPVPQLPAMTMKPYLQVDVVPQAPTNIRYVPSPVTHVVLRVKGSDPIQPLVLDILPIEWGNALGGRVASAGAKARFPLPTAPGDLEIVVVNAAGQQKVHTLKAKDRDKIR